MMQMGIATNEVTGTWCQHAVYTGPSERLAGETAIIREDPDDHAMVLAQFNRQPLYIGKDNLSLGWHQFFRTHFSTVEGKPLPPLVKDPHVSANDTWSDHQLYQRGLFRAGGKIKVVCCCCKQTVDFLPDPADWCEFDDYYCGGSPTCCP